MGAETKQKDLQTDKDIKYDPEDIRSILLAERVDKIYRGR
jgi:hypothetical protein